MIELAPSDALALSLHHNPGVFAVLAGSGLSRAAEIPTGWDITLDLIRRLAALESVTDEPDWAAWFRKRHKSEPNYSELLDALASTPSERRAILHSYIEPAVGSEARRPTKAHRALAQLVVDGFVRVIITTNFDRLIETALREAGIEPVVIASDDALVGATPLVHTRCAVVKLHGDYLDTRIKNTDAELDAYSAGMNQLIDEVFDKFGLLVIGWSAEWDAALRGALMRASSRRYPLYWAVRGIVGGLAKDLIDHRQGRIVKIDDADSFFHNLGNSLAALRDAARPHVQSVEMALALTKRYCRDDRYLMEWTEFLSGEAAKVREFISGSAYPTSSPTNASLNELVKALTAQAEILRRVCLVSGRWGTKAANEAVARTIRQLMMHGPQKSGYVYLNSLRDLPAALCFYWNLFGAAANDELGTAHRLMMTRIRSEQRESPLLFELPLQTFENMDWKFLSGHENKKTPQSAFLFDLLMQEASDASLSSEEAVEVFDDVEFLVSLEFAHQRLAIMKETGLWFFMPLGRFIWQRAGDELWRRLQGFETARQDHPAFAAGFLGGSPTAAKGTIEAIRQYFKDHPGLLW